MMGYEKNVEMASIVRSSSAVLPVCELLLNWCHHYDLMLSVRYVYWVWAWLVLMSAAHMLCVCMQRCWGVAGPIKTIGSKTRNLL